MTSKKIICEMCKKNKATRRILTVNREENKKHLGKRVCEDCGTSTPD